MRLRDIDAARAARFLHAFGWLAAAGVLWGGLIGALTGGVGGAFLGAFLGILVLGGGVGSVVVAATDRIGGLAGTLYNPSGTSTPHRKEHSHAQSLLMRGKHAEAIEAYRAHVEQDPSDPDPYIAIARLLRDEMNEPGEAAAWFRRVRADTTLDAGRTILVTRELVELYRSRLGEPLRAAPELARLADLYPNTPDGRWAAQELAELKRTMEEERE